MTAKSIQRDQYLQKNCLADTDDVVLLTRRKDLREATELHLNIEYTYFSEEEKNIHILYLSEVAS